MNVLTLLAFAAAAVSLWRGAARHAGTAARGYRWLAGAAVLWCAGVIVDMAFGGSLTSSGAPLSLLDVAPLLGLGAAAIGVMVLATPDGQGTASGQERAQGPFPGAVLPGLSDGYVMAVALLVIGWVLAFGAEFHRSGERPGTFLLDLLHPLTDLAVLGALLPVLTTAWRRVAVPYAGLLALTAADSLGVGSRVTGGHEGVLQHLAMILAAAVIGASPWIRSSHALRGITGAGTGITGAGDRIAGAWTGIASAGAATVTAAAAAVLAAIVVIANGLASAPASGLALVIAGGAAVLVLAWRVLMLVRENGSVLRLWRESGQNLRDLAARTSDVVLICDLSGVIRYASPAAGEYGYLPAQLEGQRLEEFVHPEDLAATVAAARAAIGMPAEGDATSADGGPHADGGAEPPGDREGAEPPGDREGAEPAGARVDQGAEDAGGDGHSGPKGRFICRVRAEDGTWRHVEATLLLFRVPGGPSQLLVTGRDISDQVALRQQVTHLTFHDGLTGLPNRAYVEDRARDVLTSTGTASRAGVIFIDLDGFTAVNDSVGHGAGDLVLAQAARRLRAVVPAHDTVARWGSDEFAILVEQATGSPEIAEIAEKLSAAVAREPFRVANREIALTASVGVALADGDPPGLVFRNADVAMTRARDSGGGRVEVYAAHMHADVVRRLELASDLQQAIAQEQLTLQYQPVVELATSRVTGAEALVRWWRGDESIPPREFLEVAEDSGLVVPLGEWVLREVCSQGAAWRAASWDVGVAVNVSLRQLNTPGFTERVAAALAASGLPPEALTIEVNERVLVEDAGQIVDHLARLRSLGVKLAIDDFGTGYASLAHLRRIPVDIIKIDPSFVAGLGQDETLTMLTRTIVGVGRDLGMQVVAEGIEEPRQLAALREMGCGYGQGFLVARPMAAPGLESLIRTAGTDVSHAEISTGMI